MLLGASRKDVKGYSRARPVFSTVVLWVARNLAPTAEVAREEGLLFRLLLPTPAPTG